VVVNKLYIIYKKLGGELRGKNVISCWGEEGGGAVLVVFTFFRF